MAVQRAQLADNSADQHSQPRQTRNSHRLYSKVVLARGNANNFPVNTTPDKENIASANSKLAAKKGRVGLSTRAANSGKHPGLADLDEEDLKARKKKDRTVTKHEADAQKKKLQEELLKVGTEKIAAHEDQVLLKINKTPKVNTRPPPGTITSKASRSALPLDLVVAAPIELEKDLEIPDISESDGSRADDSDFRAPPDSDTPSDSDSDAVQPHDDVFMEIDEPEEHREIRKTPGRRKSKKQECSSIRASIEAARTVGQVPNVPNRSKCKSIDIDETPSSPSCCSSLRKKSKSISKAAQDTITNSKDGINEQFNLDYGGILDEELAESAPPALRPSQVKITTQFTPNAPLIKVEALDPGLPYRNRNSATPQCKDRGYQVLNLNSSQLQQFKTLAVPAFCAVLAVQAYPWDNTAPELLKELRFIWSMVLKNAPHDIQLNTDEYARVLDAVGVYLRDTCGEAPSDIREHVEYLLEEKLAQYMWRKNDSDNQAEWEGLFLAPYIIAGITAHIEMTAGLPDELHVVDPPRGALALATVAAERGLKGWLTGKNTIGEDISKKKEEEFSEANWGEATKKVRISIERLTDKKWRKIMSEAAEATMAVKTTPKLSRIQEVDLEDAHATAYEADSE